MTINSYLPKYKSEVDFILKNAKNDPELMKSRIINLCYKGFIDGLNASLETKTRNVKSSEKTKEFNESLGNFYVEKNIEEILVYFINSVKQFEENGNLTIGWEDGITDDIKNIIKVVYDTGLANGVTLASDPYKLKTYLSNKKRIEDGEY